MIYLFYCVLSLLYFLPCSTPAKVEVASAIQQPISSSSSSLPASISPSRSACNSSSLPPLLFPSDLQFAERAWNNNRMRKNSWQGRGCQGHRTHSPTWLTPRYNGPQQCCCRFCSSSFFFLGQNQPRVSLNERLRMSLQSSRFNRVLPLLFVIFPLLLGEGCPCLRS